MNSGERQTDLAKQRRIEDLLDRVRAARAEIVETGLSAVRGAGAGDGGAAGRSCAVRAGG